MTTVDLVKNKILYFDEALKVLDGSIDYSLLDEIKNPVSTQFSYHFAMDCEMVWVNRGNPPYDHRDLRKSYEFKLEEFTCHLEKVQLGINKTGDEATSLIEYIDWRITLPRDALKGEPNASKIRKARADYIEALKTELSCYVLTVARVTIVNWNGYIVYDKFIKQTEPVVWCPPSSGICNNFYQLLNATPPPQTIPIPGKIVRVTGSANDINTLGMAQGMVNLILRDSSGDPNHIMIGHNLLESDYYAMRFSQSQINKFKKNTRDTAYLFGYEPFLSGEYKIYSLKIKNLVKGFLKKDIQMGTGHDPSEDARGALAIYKLFREGIESNTPLNITAPCPLYPLITNKHSTKSDPTATNLLNTVIADLLINLSQIHTDIKGTLKDTDLYFLIDVRDKYIEYLKYLLS
jgi:hypothetical protein